MKRTNLSKLRTLVGLAVTLSFGSAYAAPPAASTTTLAVSSSTVASGAAVTLTATVVSNSAPVTPGQVTFCDATATLCEGTAVLGTAQLKAGGTAAIQLVLGTGPHSVLALFNGKGGVNPSISSAQSVTVTGALPTSTTISFTGSAGAYSLSANVGYHGLLVPGAGETVSFIDTTNADLSLGTATLSSVSTPVYAFISLPSSPFNSGSFPAAEAVADFNGDGIGDLAVANFTANTVSVYAGDGKGGFGSQITGSPFTVGDGPGAIAVADVNNDGRADILVLNSNTGSVSVLLGTSGNSLILSGSFTTGSGPQAITVADFNHDGNADMAIANLLDSTLTVLLGDGTGNFSNPGVVSAYTSGNPNAIVTADFSGDNVLDLAVSNLDGTLSLLLGNGDGTFTAMPGSPFTSLAYPQLLAVGDFNNDGKADLAIVDTVANQIVIALNNGAGSYTSPAGSPFATGSNPSAIAVSDFNGDGFQDIVLTNSGDSTVTVLLNNGVGVLTPSTDSPLGGFSAPSAVAVADLNGDGTPDLAVANLGANKISIRPLQISQTATATLSPAIAVSGGGPHLVDASFAGDTSYGASTSSTISLTGSLITTAATLAVSPATTVQYLQTMQLTGSITPSNKANYTATGTGAFFDGATQIGSGTVSSGQAVASLNSLAVGNHSITFKYPGDTNFVTSTSVATPVVVTKASTTIKVTTSGPATPGTSVTLTATVTPGTSGVPTGTVTFFSDGTQIGTGTLNGSGVATLSTTTLASGTHTITASYTGDGNYAASTTGTPATTITISDFTLTAATTSGTVVPGSSTTFQLVVTPVNGSFTSPITFTTSGLPTGATATFVPNTVTPGPSASTLNMIVTAAPQTASLAPTGIERTAAVGLALLVLPFAIRRKLRFAKAMRGRLLAVVLLLLTGAIVSGCGSGSGYFGQAAKSYTVTVTATSGSLSHSTTVSVTVQ